MATATKTKTGSPLQSTRQMLDELDALMDRMLALPVGDAEELPPLPRDVTSAEKPASVAMLTHSPAAAPAAVEDRLEAEADDKLSMLSEGDSLDLETRPLVEPSPPIPSAPRLDDFASLAAPHFAPAVYPEEKLPPPVVPKRTAEVEPAPAPEIRRRDDGGSLWPGWVLLAPLVWINQGFDAGSRLLGPVGRGMRGKRGRTVLGIVGLLCLGLAGALFVFDHMTWP